MTSLIDYVAEQFNVSPIDLRFSTKTRKREIVVARQVCMYFSSQEGKISQSNAAMPFGKDRCTAIHAIKTVNNLYDTYPDYRRKIDRIREMIESKEVDAIVRPLLLVERMAIGDVVMDEERYTALQTN